MVRIQLLKVAYEKRGSPSGVRRPHSFLDNQIYMASMMAFSLIVFLRFIYTLKPKKSGRNTSQFSNFLVEDLG